MIRIYTLIGVVFGSLLSFFLFEIKYRVVELEKDLKKINRELFRAKEEFHLLKAEWSYLNNPKRIEYLSKRYLKLEIPKHTQFDSYELKKGLKKSFVFGEKE